VQTLISECDAPVGPESFGCAVYINAIADVMTENAGVLRNTNTTDTKLYRWLRSTSICPDKRGGTTGAALVQAFKNWAHEHPEHWTADPSLAVMVALNETWPCR
jgi:hypothetical protein